MAGKQPDIVYSETIDPEVSGGAEDHGCPSGHHERHDSLQTCRTYFPKRNYHVRDRVPDLALILQVLSPEW